MQHTEFQVSESCKKFKAFSVYFYGSNTGPPYNVSSVTSYSFLVSGRFRPYNLGFRLNVSFDCILHGNYCKQTLEALFRCRGLQRDVIRKSPIHPIVLLLKSTMHKKSLWHRNNFCFLLIF